MSGRILIVDDLPGNLRLLEAVLVPRGYTVETAGSGSEALECLARQPPDLVLLDLVMPEIDGYEVCRWIRATPQTEALPVIMITASGRDEKRRALDVGADDFLMKPLDQDEMLARVRSLLRIKRYHDTIQHQAAELTRWNRELEDRVASQVAEMDRMARLKRFLSPAIAELIVSAGDESFLESHRREITVVFCDLRGYSTFAETVEPEETMRVLQEYHATLGELIFRFEATLERFAGDGLMVFFNDPVACPDGPERAVRMAVAMRDRVGALAQGWRKRGHALGFGVGIAHGYATLGRVGFEGRYDYAAIGTVTTLAARLSDVARDGQILVSERVHAVVEEIVTSEELDALTLKGFTRAVIPRNVLGLAGAS